MYDATLIKVLDQQTALQEELSRLSDLNRMLIGVIGHLKIYADAQVQIKDDIQQTISELRSTTVDMVKNKSKE